MTSARRVTWAVAGSLFAITVAAFLRPPLLPDIGRDLTLSSLGLGALGSVFALGRLAADIPAGRLSDSRAPGAMMIASASMVAVGSLALAAAPTSTVAFVAVFVLGIGSTWTLTTAQAHFATAPRARRGLAMSFFAAALLTGQAIGPVVGGAIGSVWDWRTAVGAGAVISVVVIIPLSRLGATPSPSARTEKEVERPPDGRDTTIVLTFIYLLPAVQFAMGAALIQTLVPIVADEDLGLGVGIVGTVLGVGGVARLVSALGAGWIMDNLGRRAALIPGLVLQLAGVTLFAVQGSLAALWVSVALVSLGSVSVNVGATLLADLSEGGRLGPRLGAFRFTGDAAFLVAPVLAGWLLGIQGRAVATLPLVALTAVVLLGCLIWVPETKPAGS
jgi:MFS family permease